MRAAGHGSKRSSGSVAGDRRRYEEMRKQMVECKTRKTAVKQMPWAAKVVKVEAGYMGFESIDDWQTWSRQK